MWLGAKKFKSGLVQEKIFLIAHRILKVQLKTFGAIKGFVFIFLCVIEVYVGSCNM